MKTIMPKTAVNTLWLSDIHIDKASVIRLSRLLDQIANTLSDCVVISGDMGKNHAPLE